MRVTLELDDDDAARLRDRFPGVSDARAVELAIDAHLRREGGRAILELAGAFPDMIDVSEENKRLDAERFERLWGA